MTESTINPISNITVITSVSFISICTALLIFIKNFYSNVSLDSPMMLALQATAGLFVISALLTYVELARNSCSKDDILSTKFFAYIIGITLFVISAIMVIRN